MRRRVAFAVAVAAVLTSCSSGHHAAAPTTSTAQAASPNPDVVPAVITPAYVDAVFRVLNHVNGDAVRATVAAKGITPGVMARLRAIYGGPLYEVEVRVYEEALAQGLTNLRNPPGDRVTSVLSLLQASRSCIFVRTVSSLAAVEEQPTASPASEYWKIQPKDSTDDPQNLNPTPWAMTYNQDYETPTTVPDQC